MRVLFTITITYIYIYWLLYSLLASLGHSVFLRYPNFGLESYKREKSASDAVVRLKLNDIGEEKVLKLDKDIYKYAKLLRKLGYAIKPRHSRSLIEADKNIRIMEHLLNLSPRFHQKTVKRKSANLLQDTRYHNPSSYVTGNEEGKESSDTFVANNESPNEGIVTKPSNIIEDEVEEIEKIVDDGISASTGIDDYTGFMAAKEAQRAAMKKNMAISMGLDPETAMYLSATNNQQFTKAYKEPPSSLPSDSLSKLENKESK